jgi:DNA-directed RNA polymerase specialized sigma24 family protein
LDRLPLRSRRVAAGEDAIDDLPAREADPEASLVAAQTERGGEAAQAALQSALRQLPSVDRLVLRLRNEEGLQVADIARSLGLEPRMLYRHLARLYRDLKKQLAARGISAGVLSGRDTPPERYLPGAANRGGPDAHA